MNAKISIVRLKTSNNKYKKSLSELNRKSKNSLRRDFRKYWEKSKLDNPNQRALCVATAKVEKVRCAKNLRKDRLSQIFTYQDFDNSLIHDGEKDILYCGYLQNCWCSWYDPKFYFLDEQYYNVKV